MKCKNPFCKKEAKYLIAAANAALCEKHKNEVRDRFFKQGILLTITKLPTAVDRKRD